MKTNKMLIKAPLLISILALLLITTLFVASGSSTAQTIDFTLEVPSQNINTGETFKVVLKITNQSIKDFKLAGLQTELNFDSSLFTIEDVNDLSGADTISRFTNTENSLKYICVNDFLTSTEGYEVFGDIFEITLSAKQDIADVSTKIAPNSFSLLLGNTESAAITNYTLSVMKNGEAPEVVKGDVNNDTRVTTADAVYLLYNTTFGSGEYPVSQLCDFDGNDTVNGNDAIYLLYHVIFGEQYPLK